MTGDAIKEIVALARTGASFVQLPGSRYAIVDHHTGNATIEDATYWPPATMAHDTIDSFKLAAASAGEVWIKTGEIVAYPLAESRAALARVHRMPLAFTEAWQFASKTQCLSLDLLRQALLAFPRGLCPALEHAIKTVNVEEVKSLMSISALGDGLGKSSTRKTDISSSPLPTLVEWTTPIYEQFDDKFVLECSCGWNIWNIDDDEITVTLAPLAGEVHGCLSAAHSKIADGLGEGSFGLKCPIYFGASA